MPRKRFLMKVADGYIYPYQKKRARKPGFVVVYRDEDQPNRDWRAPPEDLEEPVEVESETPEPPETIPDDAEDDVDFSIPDPAAAAARAFVGQNPYKKDEDWLKEKAKRYDVELDAGKGIKSMQAKVKWLMGKYGDI